MDHLVARAPWVRAAFEEHTPGTAGKAAAVQVAGLYLVVDMTTVENMIGL